jgi:hypothetical protein
MAGYCGDGFEISMACFNEDNNSAVKTLHNGVDRIVINYNIKITSTHSDGFLLNQKETLKNGVFLDVTSSGSCKNRRFGGTWSLFHQGDKNR